MSQARRRRRTVEDDKMSSERSILSCHKLSEAEYVPVVYICMYIYRYIDMYIYMYIDMYI